VYGIRLTSDYLETITVEQLHSDLAMTTRGALHELIQARLRYRDHKKDLTQKEKNTLHAHKLPELLCDEEVYEKLMAGQLRL
jgi:hypothetical protein